MAPSIAWGATERSGAAADEEPGVAGESGAAAMDEAAAAGIGIPAHKTPVKQNTPPESSHPVRIWLCQFDALFLKCMETLIRRWGALCLVVLAPTVALLFLNLLKDAAYKDLAREPFPLDVELAPEDGDGRFTLPECFVFDSMIAKSRMDCVNLAYTWSGGSEARTMVEAIVDGIGAPAGTERSDAFRMFDSPEAAAAAIFHSPGLYDAVLVVEAAGAVLEYALWKNETAELYAYRKFGHYHHYAHVQQAIEQAATKSGIGSLSGGGVSLTLRKLPALSQESGADGMKKNYPQTLDASAGTMLVLGLSLSVCLTIELVAQEKREGLLGLLRMTGLRESTYWLSWFLSLSVVNFLAALLMSLVGLGTGLDLFSECNALVHTFAAFLYMSATCAFVMVFAAITKQAQYVQLTMFVVVLFNLIFQAVVADVQSSDPPTDFWSTYSTSNPGIGALYKLFFFFLPVYHYGKITRNIYDVTGTEGGRSVRQASDARWSDTWPSYYNFGRIYDKIGWNSSVGLSACVEGTDAHRFGCKGLTIMCSNSTWTLPPCPDGALCDDDAECDWLDFEMRRVGSWWIPSTHDDFWCLIALTVLYLFLSWYLAQVFSAGTGSSKPFYFIFQPSYWLGTSARHQDLGDSARREQELSAKEGSCRLLKLSKSYASTTALKELTLQMHADEIFCLLGHNGAGKSTTINLLTGLHPPTHGHAFVCGHSIVTSVNTIQGIMGVCPQDNVLFEGLTASSHMSFWGRFKGMARSGAGDESDRLLQQVALGKVKQKIAGSYSGGMKRRLSIAIASTACPRIVFLDEPTTGLDPLSRMRTWDSIMSLKADRVVCLTTHSMEEAEALGDIIGILASAKLRALGTPLFLKAKYGRGYQLTIMGDDKKSSKVLRLIRAQLPSSEVISNESGRIILGVPKRIFHLFPAFFAKLEEDARAGRSLVDEWGLSASTLEEVFLKVAVANDSVNAEVEDMGNDLYPGLALNTRPGETVMLTLTVAGKEPLQVNHVVAVACEKAHGPAPVDDRDAGPRDGAQPMHLPFEDICRGDEEGDEVRLEGGAEQEEGEEQEQAEEAESVAPEAEDNPGAEQDLVQLVVPDGHSAGASLMVQLPDGAYVTVPVPPGAKPGDAVQVPYQRENRDQFLPQGDLLPHPSEFLEQPSCMPARQVAALLLKSYTLQKKQWKANCCRCCCVGCLVVINMLLLLLSSLMVAGQEGFDNPCPANYRIDSPGYDSYACQQQGTCTEGPPACRQEDFVGFLVGAHQCNRDEAGLPPAYASWTHIARNGACWRTDYEWIEQSCYGATGCAVTHTEDPLAAGCPAGGSTNFSSACAPREQLPDLCSVRGSQARVQTYIDDQDFAPNEWYSLTLSEAAQEAMSRASVWHDGNGMDASWISGLVDDRYFTMGASSGSAGTWTCGSSMLELREVASIPDLFLGRQEAKRASETSVDTFQCSLPDDPDERAWEFRNFLGIDTKFRDSRMPYDASDVEAVIGNFFAPENDFPDLGFSLKSSDVASGQAVFDVWVYGQDWETVEANSQDNLRLQPPYPYAQTAFRLPGQNPTDCAVLSAAAPTQPGAIRAAITALHNGLFFQMGAAEPVIKSRVVPLPRIEFKWNGRFTFLAVVVLMLPMLSMIYFPVMTFTIQQERADRNVLAMQLQSLKLPTYWVATYLWNTLLYWSVVGMYYLFGVLTKSEVFTDVSHGKFLLVLALWCHAQICLATFLASVLGQSKLSALITYSIVLVTVITAPIMLELSLGSDDAWAWYVLLLGPANFIRSFIIVLSRGLSEYSDDERNEFFLACMLQFFWSLFLFALGIIIHMLLSNEVSSSVIWSWLAQRLCGKAPASPDEVMAVEDGRGLEPDVEAEAERVAKANADAYVVRVQDLEKVYPGGFRAVKGVSFGIEAGECFGLLGPNGAGKTTTISMLSASIGISAGQATVCGMDIQTNQSGVYQNLGICPQFDIYWREATVIDHLLLFARLKGVPRSQQILLVTRVAEAVGLAGDSFRMPAEQLSGGQRRRLSLAIALVANPKVVFLDEPSTGLDPQTRQGLWKIVTNMRAGRAIVLTTHSMEEADALCHRIGIMAHGQLRCIGTSLHLKNKFGTGYQLAVSLQGAPRVRASTEAREAFAARLQILDGFIRREVCEGATPVQTWKGAQLRTYALPVEGLRVSRVFEVLSDARKREYHIQDWSLNQTSLNDVFMRIATQAERE